MSLATTHIPTQRPHTILAQLGEEFEVIEDTNGSIEIIKGDTRYAIITQLVDHPFCEAAEEHFLEQRNTLKIVSNATLKIDLRDQSTKAITQIAVKAKLQQKRYVEKTALIVEPEILKGFICEYSDTEQAWVIGRPLSNYIFEELRESDDPTVQAIFNEHGQNFWRQNTSSHINHIPTYTEPRSDLRDDNEDMLLPIDFDDLDFVSFV